MCETWCTTWTSMLMTIAQINKQKIVWLHQLIEISSDRSLQFGRESLLWEFNWCGPIKLAVETTAKCLSSYNYISLFMHVLPSYNLPNKNCSTYCFIAMYQTEILIVKYTYWYYGLMKVIRQPLTIIFNLRMGIDEMIMKLREKTLLVLSFRISGDSPTRVIKFEGIDNWLLHYIKYQNRFLRFIWWLLYQILMYFKF